MAQQLGLSVEPVSTQVIPRDRHAMFFATLGVIASTDACARANATAAAIRTIEVALSANPYPVVIGRGALSVLGEQILAQGIKAGTKVLVVLDGASEAVRRSVRNLEKVKLIAADQLNVFDLLHANKLVVSEEALAKIQEVYGDG